MTSKSAVRFATAALLAAFVLAAIDAANAPCPSAEADTAPEPAFLRRTQSATERMMAGMHVAPSGDVDSDFAAMMIPHHRGAVEMAIAELCFGRNVYLRRIAQEIVVEQQQEIAAMRQALNQPLQEFVTNPAGAAIVNAVGPIRQLMQGDVPDSRRYLVILDARAGTGEAPVEIQQP